LVHAGFLLSDAHTCSVLGTSSIAMSISYESVSRSTRYRRASEVTRDPSDERVTAAVARESALPSTVPSLTSATPMGWASTTSTRPYHASLHGTDALRVIGVAVHGFAPCFGDRRPEPLEPRLDRRHHVGALRRDLVQQALLELDDAIGDALLARVLDLRHDARELGLETGEPLADRCDAVVRRPRGGLLRD